MNYGNMKINWDDIVVWGTLAMVSFVATTLVASYMLEDKFAVALVSIILTSAIVVFTHVVIKKLNKD